MLKVKVKCRGEVIDLPDTLPGTQGGSMTDYGAPGTEIIHFLPTKDGGVKIMKSTGGATLEKGLFRVTMPLKEMETIKILKPGDKFELPFVSKYGDALLMFECL
mgnify:CR=1 FL=1